MAIERIFNAREITPPCPYFGECGGCQLQHLTYDSQLELKRKTLQERLKFLVKPEEVPPVIPSPRQWHYRRRIQVHATPLGEAGFFSTGSHEVIPIQECLIAEVSLNQALEKVAQEWEPLMKAKNRPSLITYELTLEADGEVMMRPTRKERFFLQVNSDANEKLIDYLQKIFNEIRPQEVLELHAGSGNFTFSLFSEGMQWVAVEWDQEAWQEGKDRSPSSAIQWVHDKAERFLKKLKRQDYDLVLMDPPRAGAKGCLDFLIKKPAPHLIYLSCSPDALARDLPKLVKGGYQIEKLQAFDFFPQTEHLETLVFLRH